MRKLGTKPYAGSSGKQYEFNVYPGDMRFNDFIPGVYVISQEESEESGENDAIVFVGETDNVDVQLQNHELQACFDEKGYNRISFYKNASRELRQSIVEDLVPMLKPSCND